MVFLIRRGNTSRNHSGMFFRGRDLSTRGRVLVLVKIILESVLIAIKSMALLTDIESCIAKLTGLAAYLSGIAGSFTAHDFSTLGLFADESVTIKI